MIANEFGFLPLPHRCGLAKHTTTQFPDLPVRLCVRRPTPATPLQLGTYFTVPFIPPGIPPHVKSAAPSDAASHCSVALFSTTSTLPHLQLSSFLYVANCPGVGGQRRFLNVRPSKNFSPAKENAPEMSPRRVRAKAKGLLLRFAGRRRGRLRRSCGGLGRC